MTSPQTNSETTATTLEIKGNLLDHPLAELLAEISQTELSGSLKVSHSDEKAIAYFDCGRLIFAVSNARHHRLFHILLRDGEISAAKLTALPNFSNDVELGTGLVKKAIFTEKRMKEILSRQVKEIIRDALEWNDGSWTFSSLVRLKEGIRVPVDLADLLFDYGRKIPVEKQVRRFTSSEERFGLRADLPMHVNLQPHEAFVFSRLENESHSIAEIKNLSGLSEGQTLRALYVLWLGGFLKRQRWSSAFSRESVQAISSARIELKRSAVIPKSAASKPVYKTPEKKSAPVVSLEEYLTRAEKAESYYAILGVSSTAAAPEIKAAYFQLAKHFHPDLFYRRVEDELHRRIQRAFTELAQAYETLRNTDSREVYDFRLRKETANPAKRPAADAGGVRTPAEMIAAQAAENFEQGFELINENEHEDAIPFLARAVHLAGGNARYRAFYGRALSAKKETCRQAEAEFQAALRIEPDNSEYRLMLAELFVQVGFVKRAESELKRILEKSPANAQARSLLDSLPNK